MRSENQLIELDIKIFEDYLKNSSPLSYFLSRSQPDHVKKKKLEV